MCEPLLALMVLAAAEGAAVQLRQLDGAEARRALENDGGLSDARVDGQIDLGNLRHPTGGTLTLQTVFVAAGLRNAPAAPLEISCSAIHGMRAGRTVWSHPLTIDRTIFTDRFALDHARLEKTFACRGCTFRGSVAMNRARFDDEADFAFSTFTDGADFSGTRFRAVAFDGARFGGNAAFDEAEFAGAARFVGIDIAGAAASFRGAMFRDEASFRGCRIDRGVFAPAPEGDAANPFANMITSFGGIADFRRCRFGRVADFTAAALRMGARFDGATFDGGTLTLRGLTHAGGEIVLRGVSLRAGAAIAADEAAIDTVVAGPALLETGAWRDLPVEALDALAGRARTLGALTESRRLAFAATARRAGASEATWTERANFGLQWPTQNFTDLGRPLALGALAWLAALLAVLGRGVLAAVAPSDDRTAGLLARVVEPLYRPIAEEAAARQAWCPATPLGRGAAAAAFGFALVFKLGSRRWRPVAPGGWRPAVLGALWLAGFVLVAMLGLTALRMLPGLGELAGAIPA